VRTGYAQRGMSKEHQRLVKSVADAQRRGKQAAWSEEGGEHLVLPGVTFIPTHAERNRAETRPTFWSRGAMFLLSGALSLLFGACSTWDEHSRRIPYGLLAAGLLALALGVIFAREVTRADGARKPHQVHRHGLYLFDDGGAMVLAGDEDAGTITRPFSRGEITGTTYQRSDGRSRTHLVTRDDEGAERILVVNDFDVRPVVDAWVKRVAT
jgi:hypothetical protein